MSNRLYYWIAAKTGSIVLILSFACLGMSFSSYAEDGPGLRVGTFNAQFMPWAATEVSTIVNPCCDGIPMREVLLAERIILSDYDVIALNEVFDEESQEVLAKLLRNDYPYIVQYVDGEAAHSEIDVVVGNGLVEYSPCYVEGNSCEDTGLMLFSKFPFSGLGDIPNEYRIDSSHLIAAAKGRPWSDVAFKEFSKCSGSDCYSNKGAVLVKVEHPVSNVEWTIVFTHMNSGNNKRVMRVRTQQLAEVADLIKTFVDTDNDPVLLLGDLNFDGAAFKGGSATPWDVNTREEWNLIANASTGFYSQNLRDTWEFWRYAPDMPFSDGIGREVGFTYGPYTPPTNHKRLDYIFANEVTDHSTSRPYCFQHMTVAYNLASGEPLRPQGMGKGGTLHLSDHFGVNADINSWSPHCSSAEAKVLMPSDFDAEQGLVVLSGANTTLEYRGSMQWTHINEPGTYAITTNAEEGLEIDFEVYKASELSVPLQNYRGESRQLDVQALDKTLNAPIYNSEGESLYIRFFSPRQQTGDYQLIIQQHNGTSPEDAIALNANAPDVLSLAGIGGKPARWFMMHTDGPYWNQSQHIDILAHPDIGNANLYLFNDPYGFPIDSGPLALSRDNISDNNQKFYLLVETNEATSVTVGWQTNLTVFGPTGPDWAWAIRAIEETDWGPGDDDDVRLQFIVDGRPIWHVDTAATIPTDVRPNMRDFDTGQKKEMSRWIRCAIGYIDGIDVNLEEYDDVLNFNNDHLIGHISPRPTAGVLIDDFESTPEIVDINELGGGGLYRLFFNVKRSKSNQMGALAKPSADEKTLICP